MTERLRRPVLLCLFLATGAHGQELVPGWGLCGNSFQLPVRPALESPVGDPGETQMAADSADLVDENVSTLTGNVQIYRDGVQLQADKVVFNSETEVADAFGNARLWSDTGLFLRGDAGRMDLAKDINSADQAEFMLWEPHGHGTADSLTLIEKRLLQGSNAQYTTCNADDITWVVKASEMELNREEEWGEASNVTVEFGGVTIFYSPHMTFPLSDRRKTGFLAPGYGHTASTGFEAIVPYYWNISPQRDATFAVRGMSERGPMLMGEYRYLLESNAEGTLEAELLPMDLKRDEFRGLVHFTHSGTIKGNWYSDIDYHHVTDSDYFVDLGTNLDVTATQFLTRRGTLGYSGDHWLARAKVQAYQTVDRTVASASRPYRQLPNLLFQYDPPQRNRRLHPFLRGEYVYFQREDRVIGHRLDLKPTVTFPIRTSGAFLVPSATARATHYRLEDTPTGIDSEVNRFSPSANLDAGLFFERELELAGGRYTHTLEPRLYYLYRPFESQTDIAVFDTSVYSFSFAQLFRDDRFSGPDRVGDANQMTMALSSRLLAADGDELLRASVGQIRYFRDRKVTLPGHTVDDDNESDIVAEAAARVLKHWRVVGGLQWNVDESRTDKSTLSLRYNPDSKRVVNLSYRFVRDVVETGDLSARWPFGINWAAVGRLNYSIPRRQLIDTFAGVEYNSCCWAFRVVGRRFLVADTSSGDAEYENGAFLELELKGLAGVGNSAATFLKRSIPGYQNEF